MKYLVLFSLVITSLFSLSSSVKVLKWNNGLTLLQFLQNEKLPESLYYNADYDDKKAIEDIQANSKYYVLRDKNGNLKQALIPLSEELQIHIYRNKNKYFLENIPIEYFEKNEQFIVRIKSYSVYNDIKKVTNSSTLASFFVKTLKDRINFQKDIHKRSIVAMLYKRKYRLGNPFGGIDLKIAMLETGRKKRYVLKYDSRNYNAKGQYVEKHTFHRPVKPKTYWLSSKFTKKRWHPILKKYRAHLGTDYAAKRGTPIYSSGDGTVVFSSRTRGYGNLVKIKHKGGYLTLYAHMKYFAKGIKRGVKVKIGQQIGAVGTTGLSTGPHLHFGFYKDGIAIDPESMVSIQQTIILEKIDTSKFIRLRNLYKNKINGLVRRFKKGQFTSVRYDYPNLISETTLTSFDDVESDDQIVEDLENKEQILYPYPTIIYSDDNEELPLSEDYLQY